MRPLTAEKRNRKSKKTVFSSLPFPRQRAYVINVKYIPPRFLSLLLCLSLFLSAALHLLIQRAKNVLCSL